MPGGGGIQTQQRFTTRRYVQSGVATTAPVTGQNTYVTTLNPVPTSLSTGMTLSLIFAQANTGASTLNVNGLGVVAIKKNVNSDLSSGDILAGQAVQLIYDGTNWQLDAAQVLASGSGTVGTVPLWTGSTVLGNSSITQSGTDITIGGAFTVTGATTLKDSLFTLQDNADATKQFQFQLSGITAGNTRTWTVPDTSDTFVGLTATQTITNKTLGNTNTITLLDTNFTLQDDGDQTKQFKIDLSSLGPGATRTWTVPNATDTFTGIAAPQTLTNKTLTSPVINGATIDTSTFANGTITNTNSVQLLDSSFTLQDNADATKQFQFQLSGITAGNTRTWAVPDTSDTFVGLTATQTITNKTIGITNTVTLLDSLFTLQDNGDNTKQFQLQLSGITAGNTRTWTVPDTSDTFVGLTATQTLTNKTLTSPVINGATIDTSTFANGTITNTNSVQLLDSSFTLQDNADATKQFQFQLSGITAGNTRTWAVPDTSDTFVGLTATQTITNKTLGITNTVTLLDSLFTLQDNGDNTKQAQLQLGNISAGQTRVLTVQDKNTTIAGIDDAYFTYQMVNNAFSPADSTTYFAVGANIAPQTTDTNSDVNLGVKSRVIAAIVQVAGNTTSGSNENVALSLKNITQAATTSIGNFTSDGSATLIQTFTFTGLNIALAAADFFTMQFDTPAWATNPVATRWFVTLILKRDE